MIYCFTVLNIFYTMTFEKSNTSTYILVHIYTKKYYVWSKMFEEYNVKEKGQSVEKIKRNRLNASHIASQSRY